MAGQVISRLTSSGGANAGVHVLSSSFYGICTTAANAQIKKVIISDIHVNEEVNLVKGMLLTVRFTNINTGGDDEENQEGLPFLQIYTSDGNTAITDPIHIYARAGNNIKSEGNANDVVSFVYDVYNGTGCGIKTETSKEELNALNKELYNGTTSVGSIISDLNNVTSSLSEITTSIGGINSNLDGLVTRVTNAESSLIGSIKDFDLEYIRWTSATDTPSQSAQDGDTNPPTYSPGYYIWQRARTEAIGANGLATVTYSVPVCISGRDGANAESTYQYYLTASPSALINNNGVLSPTSVVFTSSRAQGTEAPSGYPTYRIISEFTEPNTGSIQYQGSNGQDSLIYQPSNSNVSLIKCTIYDATETSVQLDTQTVPIIKNGRNGTSVTVDHYEYGISNAATTDPEEGSPNYPSSISKGSGLGTKTVYTGTTTPAIIKSYIGTDGEDGNSVTINSINKDNGITTVVLDNGDGTTSSIIIEDGINGQPGNDSYVHFAGANSADGQNGFTPAQLPNTEYLYMGVYTDNNEEDSEDYQDYTGTLIKGEDGEDSYSILLTNENHTFAATYSAAISASINSEVIAYKGTTPTSVAFASTAITNPTPGMSVSYQNSTNNNNAYFTVSVSPSLTTNTRQGRFSIPLIVDGKSFSKDFSGSLASAGMNGINAYNSTTVLLYKRNLTTPTQGPIGALNYTFSTGELVPATASGSFNNGSVSIPDGVDPCGVIAGVAAAEATATSDNIESGSEPTLFVKNGTNGLDAYNHATISLYKRSKTQPNEPATPTYYTFSTGTLTPSENIEGGTTGVTAAEDGEPCGITSVNAISDQKTYTINGGSEPVIFTVDGADAEGISITNREVLYIESTSGTDIPNPNPSDAKQGSTTIPSITEGNYLGTKTSVTYSDGNTLTSYSVAKQGKSITVTGSTLQYATNNSTTTPTSGGQNTPPTTTPGGYIGTKTTTNYSDNSTVTSYTVSKTGTNGSNAYQYNLICSPAAVILDTNANPMVFKPSSITVSATRAQGTGNPATYAGRFKLEAYNGSNGSTVTSSTANESSKNCSIANVSTATTLLRSTLYMAGGTNTAVDVQTIPILKDGTNGTSVTITSKSITYQEGTSGTITPTGTGQSGIPSIAENNYLGTRTIVNYSDNNTTTAYSVGHMGKNGTNGANGYNQATIYLYQRSASMPNNKPTNNLTYTFETETLTSTEDYTPGSQTIPSATEQNNNPVGMIAASACNDEATDTIDKDDGSDPIKLEGVDGQPGTPGANGYNQATLFLYQRAASASATPAANSMTYTFSSGNLTANANGSRNIPGNDGNPCGVTSGVAISKNDSATIQKGVTPTKLVEDGIDGEDAYTVILSNENQTFPATNAAANTTVTSNVLAYKGTTLTSATIGSISGHVTGITASITGNSTTAAAITVCASGDNSNLLTTKQGSLNIPITVDGKKFTKQFTGTLAPAGLNQATIYVYTRTPAGSVPTPTETTANATGTFSSKSLTNTPSGWSTAFPQETQGSTTPVGVMSAIASSNTDTDNIEYDDGSTPVRGVSSGSNGKDGKNGFNQAVVSIYKQNAAQPTSADIPINNLTHTFSTGSNVFGENSSISNGGSVSLPAASTTPTGIRRAVAVSTAASDVIATNEGSDPAVKYAELARSVQSITEYYQRTNSTAAPTVGGNDGSTTPPQVNADNKYLGNYELILYNDTTTAATTPHIAGTYAKDGKGISAIRNYYQITDDLTTPKKRRNDGEESATAEDDAKGSTTPSPTSVQHRYLGTYEATDYTTGDSTSTDVRLIGAYGDNGIYPSQFIEQQYLSTSDESLVGGEWVNGHVIGQPDHYIGTRTKIIGSDDDPNDPEHRHIDYTTEIVAENANAIGEQLNRNVLTKSDFGNVITTDDCAPLPPIELVVYGNSTQDGTPNPSEPKPIHSVCAKNLLDVSAFTTYTDAGTTHSIIDANSLMVTPASSSSTWANYRQTFANLLEVGQAYVFRCKFSGNTNNISMGIGIRKSDESDYIISPGGSENKTTRESGEFVLRFTADGTQFGIWWYIVYQSTNGFEPATVTFSEIGLYRESEYSGFVPSGMLAIETAGKNLFDSDSICRVVRNGTYNISGFSNAGGIITNSKSVGQHGEWAYSPPFVLPIGSGGKITVSADVYLSGTASTSNVVCALNNHNSTVQVTPRENMQNTPKDAWTHIEQTLTINDGFSAGDYATLLLEAGNTGNTLQIKNVMLEAGSTATPYTQSENSQIRINMLGKLPAVIPSMVNVGNGNYITTGSYEDFTKDFCLFVDFVRASTSRHCFASPYNSLPGVGIELNTSGLIRIYSVSDTGQVTDTTLGTAVGVRSQCKFALMGTTATKTYTGLSEHDGLRETGTFTVSGTYTKKSTNPLRIGGDFRDATGGKSAFPTIGIQWNMNPYYEGAFPDNYMTQEWYYNGSGYSGMPFGGLCACSLPNGEKDYITIEDGRWKLHKVSGKVVLDGLTNTVTFNLAATSGGTGNRFLATLPDDMAVITNDQKRNFISDRFSYGSGKATISSQWSPGDAMLYPYSNANAKQMLLVFGASETTTALGNTWLQSNPVTVIYPLAQEQVIDLGAANLPNLPSPDMSIGVDGTTIDATGGTQYGYETGKQIVENDQRIESEISDQNDIFERGLQKTIISSIQLGFTSSSSQIPATPSQPIFENTVSEFEYENGRINVPSYDIDYPYYYYCYQQELNYKDENNNSYYQYTPVAFDKIKVDYVDELKALNKSIEATEDITTAIRQHFSYDDNGAHVIGMDSGLSTTGNTQGIVFENSNHLPVLSLIVNEDSDENEEDLDENEENSNSSGKGLVIYDGIGKEDRNIISRFTNTEIQLGAVDANSHIQITTAAMNFGNKDSIVAFASSNLFSAPMLAVNKALKLETDEGNGGGIPRANGNLSLKWLGEEATE